MQKRNVQWMFVLLVFMAGLAIAGCNKEVVHEDAPATQGVKGEPGAKGDQGNTGNQGNTGSQGNIGNQGNTGNTGSQGTQGVQGNQGAQGAPGATNYTFDMLCTKVVAETKAASGSAFTARYEMRTRDSCMAAAQAYEKVPNADAAKSAYAGEIMTSCEGKTAQDWLSCYAGEAQNAGKAAADAMK